MQIATVFTIDGFQIVHVETSSWKLRKSIESYRDNLWILTSVSKFFSISTINSNLRRTIKQNSFILFNWFNDLSIILINLFDAISKRNIIFRLFLFQFFHIKFLFAFSSFFPGYPPSVSFFSLPPPTSAWRRHAAPSQCPLSVVAQAAQRPTPRIIIAIAGTMQEARRG